MIGAPIHFLLFFSKIKKLDKNQKNCNNRSDLIANKEEAFFGGDAIC